MSPTTEVKPLEIRVSKTIFDLDSKEEVRVAKVGNFTPVQDMGDFLTRIGNDSAKALEIINDGLKSYQADQLKSDNSVSWQSEDEDGNLTPFTGTPISEDKSKQLAANVLQFAKLLFGYAKNMIPGDAAANRKAKTEAKDKALDAILSNPAVIEALKK